MNNCNKKIEEKLTRNCAACLKNFNKNSQLILYIYLY